MVMIIHYVINTTSKAQLVILPGITFHTFTIIFTGISSFALLSNKHTIHTVAATVQQS